MPGVFERLAFTFGASTGAILSFIFGGLDKSVIWMLVFMAVDFTAGLISTAINGQTTYSLATKLIAKKALILLIVILCHGADVILGTNGIRDGAVIAALINETISFLENVDKAGLGVYIPAPLRRALKNVSNDQSKEETK